MDKYIEIIHVTEERARIFLNSPFYVKAKNILELYNNGTANYILDLDTVPEGVSLDTSIYLGGAESTICLPIRKSILNRMGYSNVTIDDKITLF